MGISSTIASVAIGGYNAYKNNKRANKAGKRASIIFDEQQGYAKQLDDLMQNPSSITKLPGYQFQLDQGTEAVTRKMAATGFGGSGNMAAELMEYGQGLASSFYGQQTNLLASLSGLLSQSPAQHEAVAQAGHNSAFDQMGQVLASLGYGAGQIGSSYGSSSGNMGGLSTAADGYTRNVPNWMADPGMSAPGGA